MIVVRDPTPGATEPISNMVDQIVLAAEFTIRQWRPGPPGGCYGSPGRADGTD